MQQKVLESDDFWLIVGRLDSESYGTAPLLGGVVELGVSGDRMYLRKLWLPKAKYDRRAVDLLLSAMDKCSLCREGLLIKAEKVISRQVPIKIRGNMDKALGLVIGALGGKAFKEIADTYIAPQIGASGNEAAKALVGVALVALPYGIRMSPSVEAGIMGAGAFLLADGVGNIVKNLVTGTPMPRVELVPVSAPATPVYSQSVSRSIFG